MFSRSKQDFVEMQRGSRQAGSNPALHAQFEVGVVEGLATIGVGQRVSNFRKS
jgi:hypothetical protein